MAQSNLTVNLGQVRATVDPTWAGVVHTGFGRWPSNSPEQAAAYKALGVRYVRVNARWNGSQIQCASSGLGYPNLEPALQWFWANGFRILFCMAGRTSDWNGYVNGDAGSIIGRLKTLAIWGDGSRYDIQGPNEPDQTGNGSQSITSVATRCKQIWTDIQGQAPGKGVWGPVWSGPNWDVSGFLSQMNSGGVTRCAGIDWHSYPGDSGVGTGPGQRTIQATWDLVSGGNDTDFIDEARGVLGGSFPAVGMAVDEMNWSYAHSGSDAALFTSANTVMHAMMYAESLARGARILSYGDQNGDLSVMADDYQNAGRPQSSPFPAFWGIVAVTGGNLFPHYKDRMYQCGGDQAATKMYAFNNESGGYNIVVVNARENATQTCSVAVTNAPSAGQYYLFSGRKSNPFDAPVKTGPFTFDGSSPIAFTVDAQQVTIIQLVPGTVPPPPPATTPSYIPVGDNLNRDPVGAGTNYIPVGDNLNRDPNAGLTPPSGPNTVVATAGDARVTLTWSAPLNNGGSAVTNYSVYSVNLDNTLTFQGVYGPGITSTVITGLTNGTPMQYAVLATNAQGDGSATYSAIVTPQVAATPPPGGGGGGGGNGGTGGTGGGGVFLPNLGGLLGAPPPPAIDTSAGSIPLADPTNGYGSPTSGNTLWMVWQDLDTGEVLQIKPSRGAIWLQDWDPGWPDPREDVSNYPDRSGTIDETKYHGNKAVAVAVTLTPSIDKDNYLQPAGAYLDRLRAWTRLGRRVRILYQLRGQTARYMDVRASAHTSPLSAQGIGRMTIEASFTFKCPDGVAYQLPGPSDTTWPVDPTYFKVSANAQAGGSTAVEIKPAGLEIKAAGVDLSGVSTQGGQAGFAYRGSVPSSPIMVMYGGAGNPRFKMRTASNKLIAALEFTAAGGLTVAANETLVIDVANRTCRIPERSVPNVRKYLAPPINWQDFLVETGAGNYFEFYPQSANVGTYTDFFYRVALI